MYIYKSYTKPRLRLDRTRGHCRMHKQIQKEATPGWYVSFRGAAARACAMGYKRLDQAP